LESLSNQPFLFIVIAVVAAIVVAVAAYYILRSLKGSMEVQLASESVHAGQTLSGFLVVNARKSIDADRLYVALIGERQVRSRNSKGQSTTKWEEFYRDEVDIFMNQRLRAGAAQTHPFSIEAPTADQVESVSEAGLAQLESVMAETGSNLAVGIAKGIGKLARVSNSLSRSRRRWKVAGRLETKGVDLATSKKVHVSLKSTG